MDLSNLKGSKTDTDTNKDFLGTSFGAVDSDVYAVEIKTAYMSTSKGGAFGFNVEYATDKGNVVNITEWVTNRQGNTTYTRDGKEYTMMGLNSANALCNTILGVDLSQLKTTEKIIDLYNYDLKKKVPTPVPMLMSLVGKKAYVAFRKVIEDKKVKNDKGVYVPSGETRETNIVSKVFDYDTKRTQSEIALGEEPAFMDAWLEKYKGDTLNKAKGATTQVASSPASNTPTKPLF
jgi:hypothetical protein